jgi:hypothetical protein
MRADANLDSEGVRTSLDGLGRSADGFMTLLRDPVGISSLLMEGPIVKPNRTNSWSGRHGNSESNQSEGEPGHNLHKGS